jgi:hypothetical protein
MAKLLQRSTKKAIESLFVSESRADRTQKRRQALADFADRAWREGVQKEIANGRRALTTLMTKGPLVVPAEVLARLQTLTDAEVIVLKYEMRDFLRSIADGNQRPRVRKRA